MELTEKNTVIEKAYIKYYSEVFRYVYTKIKEVEDSKDLMHDIFLKLLEYNSVLIEDTIKNIIYVIAHNIVIDYYKKKHDSLNVELENIICDNSSMYYNTEVMVLFNNLLELESQAIDKLPSKRRIVYRLVRFESKTVGEISSLLCLSSRTVENHLRIGRLDVRNYVRQYI